MNSLRKNPSNPEKHSWFWSRRMPLQIHERSLRIHAEVPIRFLADRESLGKAVGKDFRATVVIEDAGLAKAVLQAIESDPSMNRRDESER